MLREQCYFNVRIHNQIIENKGRSQVQLLNSQEKLTNEIKGNSAVIV